MLLFEEYTIFLPLRFLFVSSDVMGSSFATSSATGTWLD
jgi:hypothetical protein